MDIDINREYKPKSIKKIAGEFGIEDIRLYGDYIAKIKRKDYENNNNNRFVLVTSSTPGKRGIGKTTTTIGIVDALNKMGHPTSGVLREPSLGPVFGLKGGACGGGQAQVYPMDEINLHFTGDMHALTTITNLINAAIDNEIFQGNSLNIDINKIKIKRAIDINDRSLRNIKYNILNTDLEINGGFELTVASEIMAILALCDNLEDFTNKVEEVIVAYTPSNKEIKVKDLNIRGSIATLARECINPNIVQTLEGNPVFVHGGPFANIAHGTASLRAIRLSQENSFYSICEAGFGSELGSEKFINIVSRKGNIKPDCIVLATTIEALKEQGEKETGNLNQIIEGLKNLERHVEIIKSYNIQFIVTLNQFSTDTEEEIEKIKIWCELNNYPFAINNSYEEGSSGALDLAQKVLEYSNFKKQPIHYTYDLNDDIETKIYKVISKIYGGKNYELSDQAIKDLQRIKIDGYENLPICIAKTAFSLSADKTLKNNPKNFVVKISNLKINAGSGFIVVYTENIMTLPGLGAKANIYKVDYDFQKDEIHNLD